MRNPFKCIERDLDLFYKKMEEPNDFLWNIKEKYNGIYLVRYTGRNYSYCLGFDSCNKIIDTKFGKIAFRITIGRFMMSFKDKEGWDRFIKEYDIEINRRIK